MNRPDIIAMAAQSGMKASIGKTVKEKGKADVYHPDVNALGKSVPVEWLEAFAALVAAKNMERLASDVSLPEPQPVNESGSTMAITRWTIEMPSGWVGAYDKTAITELLRDYGDRRAAAELEACRAACEAIADEYQKREGQKYPELKSDAQTGASDCEAAIRARGAV